LTPSPPIEANEGYASIQDAIDATPAQIGGKLCWVTTAWSPDGEQIAFASYRDGNWEIYIMNADGSDQRNVTDNPTSDGLPAWSPDGEQIAFTSEREGNFEIYLMNADGSGEIRLTNNQADDFSPA